jgi:hypothetical protein
MTAVARAHRGHRLGLLTKLAMLELVAAREPHLAFIETWNGEANAHMVAINETLGFRQTGRVTAWLLPTTPVPVHGEPGVAGVAGVARGSAHNARNVTLHPL